MTIPADVLKLLDLDVGREPTSGASATLNGDIPCSRPRFIPMRSALLMYRMFVLASNP